MKNSITSFVFLLFALAQLLSSDSSCPDQKKRVLNPFKTAWEHKKKIIAATVAAVTFFCFYKTQGKYHRLKKDFLYQYGQNGLWDENAITQSANALAAFAYDSWLVLPDQKRAIAHLILGNQQFFTDWKPTRPIADHNLSFCRRDHCIQI